MDTFWSLLASHGPEESMRWLKGRSSRKLFRGVSAAEKALLGTALLGTRYFCATVGQMTEEMIKDIWNITSSRIPRTTFARRITTGLGPVSGLSVHMTNPPA